MKTRMIFGKCKKEFTHYCTERFRVLSIQIYFILAMISISTIVQAQNKMDLADVRKDMMNYIEREIWFIWYFGYFIN